MARQFVVKLGPADRTVLGKTMAEARAAALRTFALRAGRGATEAEVEEIAETLESQRQGEKNILTRCLDSYITHVKHDLATLTEVADICRDIRDAADHLLLTERELELVKAGMDKMDFGGSAAGWLHHAGLFAQLANPQREGADGGA